MKRRVPVSEAQISKLMKGNDLHGRIEAQRTVFYDAEGNIVCELEQTFHEASPYGLKGWYMYMDEYVGGK